MDTTSSGGLEMAIPFNRNRRSALITLVCMGAAQILLWMAWSNTPSNFPVSPNLFAGLMFLTLWAHSDPPMNTIMH